ncbi:hypothetical protein [Roseateles oligotrophus]|uniref:DUF4345 domain-containing protein n=1 Tax=Roseateles oligotrophus TaxID=1769250 RepID=A0ABT2YE61_9BURK|nr:hypothetical protein [Roseateles oligotrophus]MCV2368348.1 hypothetical protein [Roseateles oligotrophus]
MKTLKQTLRYLLAAGLLLNGGAMLFAPSTWYHGMPGLWATGPLNPHLVRDVGCAYLVVALGLAWHARRSSAGQGAAIAGAAFLLLHAGVHLWEVAVGICGWSRFAQDAPGVVLPALLALYLSGIDGQQRQALGQGVAHV